MEHCALSPQDDSSVRYSWECSRPPCTTPPMDRGRRSPLPRCCTLITTRRRGPSDPYQCWLRTARLWCLELPVLLRPPPLRPRKRPWTPPMRHKNPYLYASAATNSVAAFYDAANALLDAVSTCRLVDAASLHCKTANRLAGFVWFDKLCFWSRH